MDSGDIDVHGVREGDASSLRTLAKRRGASVLAYCNHVCGPSTGPIAAAETFARTRAILRDDQNVDAIDPDQVLRRATRHTAACVAREPQGPPPSGAIPGRGTATCLDVAISLAAASDGKLDVDQRARLRAHIDACQRCQALAEITRRADSAYSEPVNDKIGSDLAERFVVAMDQVPDEGPRSAPPPVEATLCSASPVFAEIPELQDEVALGDRSLQPGPEELPALAEPGRQRKLTFSSFLSRIGGSPRPATETAAQADAEQLAAPSEPIAEPIIEAPAPITAEEPQASPEAEAATEPGAAASESVGPPPPSSGPPATRVAA